MHNWSFPAEIVKENPGLKKCVQILGEYRREKKEHKIALYLQGGIRLGK